ncbi:ORF6N domain-containing protein [Yersinia alsatica]|uniref:ORF6N domain-containing protein n=1 Tax=Yersinia alsatica TaxID=2890317 RepID=UPI001F189C2D|nr:ORF6N domain-containing protein [Yersinia alsatica]
MKTEITTSNPMDLSAVQEQTIDSQKLLVMVNEARKACGEKTIRNNDFVARIKDELEGETYENFVGQKNGADIEIIDMQMKQALRVSARESKAVRRSLVDKLEAMQKPNPIHRELSTMEILRIAMESEQGRIAEKERADTAIRAKGQISRKREASAMGKLSAATRRCRELEERLGESTKDATITKVENATGIKKTFKYAALRKWCRDNGTEARSVADERYGSVKSWPAGAWLTVYGIDLTLLFGEKK